MEINFKPRRFGMVNETIEMMHLRMLDGTNIHMFSINKDMTAVERYIIALFNKGHKFYLKECNTSRMEAIWDNDRYGLKIGGPIIIGYKTVTTFTGYTFTLYSK